MTAKVVLALSYWAASYIYLCIAALEPLAFLLAYVAHGLGHVFIVLNIGHDANHHAISEKLGVNRVLSYTMDLCGINSYMWRIMHHRAHHYCINVHGEDEAIDGRGLLRFSPFAPMRRKHRYQHLYAPLLYSLYSLDHVFLKDFRFFAVPPTLKPIKHPLREWAILVAGKVLYLGYMLGVPIFLVGHAPVIVVMSFVATHAVIGLSVVMVFQITHVLAGASFPEAVGRGPSFTAHVFATTQDCAPDNPVLSWLVGGLNRQVIHHLYPNICHTHYGNLTNILRVASEEFAMPYRQTGSFRGALKQHFLLLKGLGR